MGFDVTVDAYGQFMGRYSVPLAADFVSLLDAAPGKQALDVGCGPGALTSELVQRMGADAVSAADPSETFVGSVRKRFPRVDVRRATAENLPFETAAFDIAAAQLVVHFMTDPVAGIREMLRVTRPGGVVATSVWDHAGGKGPLKEFWQAVRSLDGKAPDESQLPGVRAGQLGEFFEAAGLKQIQQGQLTVRVAHNAFDDWWQPFLLGVGPAGGYVTGLDEDQRSALRERCHNLLPPAPFEISATAWTVVGRA